MFVGVAALAVSCKKDPEILQRSLVVYSLRQCPVAQNDAYAVVYGGGDFEATTAHPPTSSQFLRNIGATMSSLPVDTRSLVVDVSENDLEWRGQTEVSTSGSGDVNVLVWRTTESCWMTRDVERRKDMTFGVFGRHFMVAGGESAEGSLVPHSFVGDLSTGDIVQLPFGLGTRRVRPSVTAFATPAQVGGPVSALVAGGADPDSNAPIGTAEIYDPKLGAEADVGDFDPAPIALSEPRADHGAVVLSTGETLLVGGRGGAGLLNSMEIIDPITRRQRTTGVSLLHVARLNPSVLRLANGEILVAGGTDASGNAIPTLEWFAPDASVATKRPVDLVTGKERAFVPLEGGGALAVIEPQTVTPDFKTVWVISADGTLEPGLPIDPQTLTTVKLFSGAEGAPLVWTGQQWLRWTPWFGAFQAFDAPADGPALTTANGDSGLALWLQDRTTALSVTGFRFASKTRFDTIPSPLLVTGTDFFAPDRLVGVASSPIQFDPNKGLVLGAGASAFLTDVTLADFALDLDVTESPPVVVLRDEQGKELEVGGATCAFGQGAQKSLSIVRKGTSVTVSSDGAAARDCPTPLALDARVAIGLRGAQGATESAGKNLRIVRR